MAIVGEAKLDTVQIVEVDSDPRISIDENLKAGSIAIWNDNAKPVLFKKEDDATDTNWSLIHGSFLKLSENVGGSSSNASGQVFNIDLSGMYLKIGDLVVLKDFYFRGDFSGSNEFLDVDIDGNSFTIGEFASNDSNVFERDTEFQRIEVATVDIGGGVVGLQFTIDPSDAVNFSPTGMPNGWWWELLVDIMRL